MKKYAISALAGLCLAVPALSMAAAAPSTFEEKLSYSMGFEVGNYFKSAGGDIQKEFLITGIEDAFNGESPVLSVEEMAQVKKEFGEKLQQEQLAQLEEMKAKNKADGEAFLVENKKKEGVIVTESGLQYEVLNAGEGAKPTAEDTVKVEYVGTLIDGTEFDSTAKHGEPAQFQVGQVIKGWSEALQLMSVGTKLKLVIPADLAYGEKGAAPIIQPNSTLVFEVELLEIVK
ncbi:FKBP-type peptidyl-prolyl cis-trans isomerase [Desulforhopalus singaporensis]|uniref:Peptidyl-prolyl cis-trans isomerase n=1 Tax=Desulforhopalus singaporensis TaxID=91360 RepID=A0A1H0RDK4_9BACT|nr:FKBP-type peptidyl-prolyl cis-trans isomerase [Desulforhopalus singaporensis]SDP27643.1 FKBP-type peptidyl-prolyl cis-trans isomerase FklB [Desulforhopalus singaporensis]